MLDGKLFAAPIKQPPQTILDLGTGTGIWAIDMADKFPSAHVIGNDLSAIQPSWIPPNLEFIIEDFEQEWTYDENYFDFIHTRTIMGCVQDWGWLVRQAYKCLKPNGYLELQEAPVWAWSDDGTLKEDSLWMQYQKNLRKQLKRLEERLTLPLELQAWMAEAGF
ncbi:hypothetical protein VTN77DRAFT_5618 [Rasamsonia byssochlamydoides]|uniref:uncharacterized protein n=1 Tax=Rasamsonia byssochlamydoides TaxID=89139 RepID=UPI0037432F4A